MPSWHEKSTPFSTLSTVENMKFPGLSKTWEALLSNIPIPTLAMHQLGRGQVHQALTGREERDFLSRKTKISNTPFPQPDSTETLQTFSLKEEKDQFTKQSEAKVREIWNSNSQPEPGRAGLSVAIQTHISPGSPRGLCAAILSNFHSRIKKSFNFLFLTVSKYTKKQTPIFSPTLLLWGFYIMLVVGLCFC